MLPHQTAYVEIIEQPASKSVRFRYKCEGSPTSLVGTSSTSKMKTFPTIKVFGYKGKAVVVVSCVTKDKPYRPHPNNLVGRKGCNKGVCTLEINPETMSISFPNLGIQCVKKKDVEESLKVREENRVDPFRTGFNHKTTPQLIDSSVVRLCFQVFIEGSERGKYNLPLIPVVSDPIYDKKSALELVIVELSHCCIPADGGKRNIILLCEKVTKSDIEVKFFEKNSENTEIWRAFGKFLPKHVHYQTAISFKPPPYKRIDIQEPVGVYIQLKRPSDGVTSEPLPFQYLPLDTEPNILKRKCLDTSRFQQINIKENSLKSFAGAVSPGCSNNEVIDLTKNKLYVNYENSINEETNIRIERRLFQDQSITQQNPNINPQNIDLKNIRQNSQKSNAQDINNQNSCNNPHHLNLGQLGTFPIFNWNFPSTSETAPGVCESNNLNKPSKNEDKKDLITFNSNELENINVLDAAMNLSESFTNNLSLSDVDMQRNDQNEMDSLTRFVNRTIDDFVKDTK